MDQITWHICLTKLNIWKYNVIISIIQITFSKQKTPDINNI